MKEAITIQAEPRNRTGTSSMGRLRRAGQLPAIVYTEGKPGETLQVNAHQFKEMLHHHRGSEHMLIDLTIGAAKPRKVLLKEIQYHPVTGAALHVDFQAISMTQKLRVDIPVRLTGEPIGVTQQGGILDHLLRQVEIECLPADLLEEIVLDVSGLALGKHLAVKDLTLDPAKYRMVTPSDVVLAAVSMPKAEEEVAPAEGAAAEGAEPEVITAKKGEEEEGAEAPAGKEGSKAGEKEAKSAGKESKPAAGKEKSEKK